MAETLVYAFPSHLPQHSLRIIFFGNLNLRHSETSALEPAGPQHVESMESFADRTINQTKAPSVDRALLLGHGRNS